MTRRYFKITIFILSFLGIIMYLGFKIDHSEKIHDKVIYFLTKIIKENTPFKNIKMTYSSFNWGKWRHPLSFDLYKVNLQDAENGILSIEKLRVSWSIINFAKGQLNPTRLSIQNGQLYHQQQSIGNTDLTIDLDSSGYKLTLDHFYFNPDNLTKLDICPQAMKSILKDIHLPLSAAGYLHFKAQELIGMNLIINTKAGYFSIAPYFSVPLSVHDLQVHMTLDSLQKMNANIKVATGNTHLSAQGQVSFPSSIVHLWQKGGKVDLTLTGEVTNVLVNDLPKLWPIGLAHKPRKWVTTNLSQGHVNGTLHAKTILHTAPEGKVHDIILDELSGDLFPTDVTVNYLGKLPAVQHTNAHCRYNQQQFIIEDIVGIVNGIKLSQGRIIIDDLHKKDQHIQITLDLIGDAGRVMEVISEKPLQLIQKLGLPLKNAQGLSTTSVLLKFPLESDVTLKQVYVEARSKFIGAQAHLSSSTGYLIDLKQGNLDLFVDSDHLFIGGSAYLNDMPTQLQWTEYFEQTTAPFMRTLALQAHKTFIPEKEAESPPLSGNIPLDLLYQKDAKGHTFLTFTAILDDATFSLPWVSYHKQKGSPATCHIEAKSSDTNEFVIQKGVLNGENLKAKLSGNWGTEDSKLKLSKLQIGETHGDLTIAHRQGRWKLTGNVNEFDMLTLLNEWPTNDQSTLSAPDADINIMINTLVFSDSYHLKKATFGLQLTNGDIQTIHLKDNANQFHFLLTPAENGVQTFNLESMNAAELLESMSPGTDLEGGHINLIGHRTKKNSQTFIEGEIDIKDLTVFEAPLLAKILSLSSIQGIVHAISGEGVKFDHGHAMINWKQDNIMINDAYLFGTSLGLTFSGMISQQQLDFTGEIIPFYSVNSILSKIPLIGQSLSGNSIHAIFSTPFSLSGQKSDPNIQVEALSTLTPRGMRTIHR